MDIPAQPPPNRKRFRIWVAGRLSDDLAEDIGGLVQDDTVGNHALTGDFVDQSQIYGILDRLRQLGIDVLRFEIYEQTAQSSPDQTQR